MTVGLGEGISPDDFVKYYPVLYHMAEAETWPRIRNHGLLSTSALLDLYGYSGADRFAIESTHRPNMREIQHERYGITTIRDQHPMKEHLLERCLEGMTPRQWYVLLNRQVFFWVIYSRLITMLTARPYANQPHDVLFIDTSKLLARHIDKVALSPINSGSTIYNPRPRGKDTFRPLRKYPFLQRKQMRGYQNAVAELVVEYSVPDIRDFVIKVQRMVGSTTVAVLFQK